jgi:Na+/H+ antiporter NhaD/arsenite permease-like protein
MRRLAPWSRRKASAGRCGLVVEFVARRSGYSAAFLTLAAIAGAGLALFWITVPAEKVLLTPEVIASVQGLHFGNPYVLTIHTAVLSNVISNVPAVLALKPFVLGLPDQNRIWLIIAMSATLAGNLTPVGSVANLIGAERARTAGIHVSLWAYCRAGIPITLATLALGA